MVTWPILFLLAISFLTGLPGILKKQNYHFVTCSSTYDAVAGRV